MQNLYFEEFNEKDSDHVHFKAYCRERNLNPSDLKYLIGQGFHTHPTLIMNTMMVAFDLKDAKWLDLDKSLRKKQSDWLVGYSGGQTVTDSNGIVSLSGLKSSLNPSIINNFLVGSLRRKIIPRPLAIKWCEMARHLVFYFDKTEYNEFLETCPNPYRKFLEITNKEKDDFIATLKNRKATKGNATESIK